MVDAIIRPAVPEEADALTDIALRSKAHWGYPSTLIDLWAEDLRVTPESCDGESLWVIEVNRVLAGFGELIIHDDVAILDDLWIVPEHIGQRLGEKLFHHLVSLARSRGATTIRFEAEPNAVGFYQHMGAVITGEQPSATVPGRSLPIMELRLV